MNILNAAFNVVNVVYCMYIPLFFHYFLVEYFIIIKICFMAISSVHDRDMFHACFFFLFFFFFFFLFYFLIFIIFFFFFYILYK